ncbi:hypothetical protein EW146_g3621 [Bondarzewia mesenterica]|uniref:Glycosyltransferase family 25 protein n=1 Tax=Bondarzewia mesenterica TaxID=1095465 RepID=A0A4S4LX98_9AGAM|nr:hypothetical protein EW146_g3621 [Bondarzewia mesenterica]
MLALIRLAPVSPPYRRLAALLLAIPPAIFLFLGATHTKLSTRSGLTLVHPSWHTATYRDTRDSSHDSELKTHTIISGTPHVDMTFIDSSTELQLGIVSRIYVVSLPRRTDRRHRMHQLGHTLGLNWTYVDAVDIDNPAIAAILRQVRVLRNNVVSFSALSSTISNIASNTSGNTAMSKFDWPTEIDVLTSSDDPLALAGSDIWTHSSTHSSFDPSLVGETLDKFSLDLHLKNFIYRPPRPLVNLACTSGNALLPPRKSGFPAHMILTPARIACWHSHVEVIRAIATSNDEGPVLVLEDDIDMERDIQERLTTVWDALPADWDIVYLGRIPYLQRYIDIRAANTSGHRALLVKRKNISSTPPWHCVGPSPVVRTQVHPCLRALSPRRATHLVTSPSSALRLLPCHRPSARVARAQRTAERIQHRSSRNRAAQGRQQRRRVRPRQRLARGAGQWSARVNGNAERDRLLNCTLDPEGRRGVVFVLSMCLQTMAMLLASKALQPVFLQIRKGATSAYYEVQ